MIKIGYLNKLKVISCTADETLLDGKNLGMLILSDNGASRVGYHPGDVLEVFIYFDRPDRLVATTQIPNAMPGQFAFLTVKAHTEAGAILDWGLPSDLLAPINEQSSKMLVGKSYIVFLYLDGKTKLIAASSKLDKFLNNPCHIFSAGEEVDLLVCARTDLGFKAIINHAYWGLLYQNEIFQPLDVGQKLKGFVKKVRDDGKIDLCLAEPGGKGVDELAKQIIEFLKKQGGSILVSDKSPPALIYELFGASKKTFKKALGALYKRKLIVIQNDSIKLIG